MSSARILQVQAESLSNLQPFTGDLSHDVDKYIEQIEYIGALTNEPDVVLCLLLQHKLSGAAERWYRNNEDSLNTWSQFRMAFRERFQQQQALMNIHSPSPPLRVEHHQSHESLHSDNTQEKRKAPIVIGTNLVHQQDEIDKIPQQQIITHHITRRVFDPLPPPTLTNTVPSSTDNLNEYFRQTIEIDAPAENDLTTNPIDSQRLLNQLQTQTSPTATFFITIDSPKSTHIATYPPQIDSFEDLENECLRDYEQGRHSPVLVNLNDLDFEIRKRCTDKTDDWDKLKQQRESVMKFGSVKPDVEDVFEAFARSMESLTADDSIINTVVPMDVQYLWFDKRRLRKPRVFKKFYTDYDWNQYYKQHHDIDNSPSIIIQDYDFRMFYPNLNHHTTTSYNLTICEDTPDFSTLPFHAGSPYVDNGFKIVRKERNHSYNHSFRYHFPHAIVQLWFYFRKWKYRSDGSIQSVRTHFFVCWWGGLLEDDICHPHSFYEKVLFSWLVVIGD